MYILNLNMLTVENNYKFVISWLFLWYKKSYYTITESRPVYCLGIHEAISSKYVWFNDF